MTTPDRPLAVVTGASTGIGYELAKQCAENGFDPVVAADEPEISAAAEQFRRWGAQVGAVETDLATIDGFDKLYTAMVAGRSTPSSPMSGAAWARDFSIRISRRVVDTNVTGTIYLIQKAGPETRSAGKGCDKPPGFH